MTALNTKTGQAKTIAKFENAHVEQDGTDYRVYVGGRFFGVYPDQRTAEQTAKGFDGAILD